MKKLRIGYFADGPWSHLSFERIISDESLEIVFITPRFDTTDSKLKNYAEHYDIDYLLSRNVNSEEFISKVVEYKCDLFVSMSFNQIFRSEIINIPRLKTINCHAGKLPFYRGRNVLNWALINDEVEFGITVHYIDEGIDTGDIILQRTFPIKDSDDYNTLLQLSYKACADILYDAICLVRDGKVERISQESIHPVGMYCGIRGEGDEILDWNQTSREVFNFVRAICDPGPMARTYLKEDEIRIEKVKIVEEAPVYKGKPGQILCKTKSGSFYVKTRDSFVELISFEGKLRVGQILKPFRS